MLLTEIRTDGRQAHSGYSGGQEPEEDGCRRPLGPLRQDRADAERQEAEKEEDVDQEVHSQSLLQRILLLRGTLRADTGTEINLLSSPFYLAIEK